MSSLLSLWRQEQQQRGGAGSEGGRRDAVESTTARPATRNLARQGVVAADRWTFFRFQQLHPLRDLGSTSSRKEIHIAISLHPLSPQNPLFVASPEQKSDGLLRRINLYQSFSPLPSVLGRRSTPSVRHHLVAPHLVSSSG